MATGWQLALHILGALYAMPTALFCDFAQILGKMVSAVFNVFLNLHCLELKRKHAISSMTRSHFLVSQCTWFLVITSRDLKPSLSLIDWCGSFHGIHWHDIPLLRSSAGLLRRLRLRSHHLLCKLDNLSLFQNAVYYIGPSMMLSLTHMDLEN